MVRNSLLSFALIYAFTSPAGAANLQIGPIGTSKPVLTCETMIVHVGESKQTIPGSVVVEKIANDQYQVTMTATAGGTVLKTQTSKDVSFVEANVSDALDINTVAKDLKRVAPKVDLTEAKRVAIALIRPINPGDSAMFIYELKDSNGATLIKLLDIGNGGAIGRCEK